MPDLTRSEARQILASLRSVAEGMARTNQLLSDLDATMDSEAVPYASFGGKVFTAFSGDGRRRDYVRWSDLPRDHVLRSILEEGALPQRQGEKVVVLAAWDRPPAERRFYRLGEILRLTAEAKS
jgi:hypothetical protein